MLNAAGTGLAGTTDQLTFLNQRLTGDGGVTIQMTSLASNAISAMAGVTIRESLSPSSRHVSLLAKAGTGLLFSRRRAAGGATTETSSTRRAGPIWLRLEREGSAITAFTSVDGSQWQVAGRETIALAASVFVGVAVTSKAPATTVMAAVSGLSMQSSAPTLPADWASADVGSAQAPGAASFSDGTYLAMSSGSGLAGTADAFRFVYSRVSGDTDLIARVAGLEGAAGGQAGIILRDSLDAGAPYISLLSNGTRAAVRLRIAAQLPPTGTRSATTTVPVWLKLERRADLVRSSYSTNGSTWTLIGTDVVPMSRDLYAGLAVTGSPAGVAAAGGFDHVSLASVSANLPPEVSLTGPLTGRIYRPGDPVAITASSTDPDDLVARVDFFVNGTKVASDSSAPYAAVWPAGAIGAYLLSAVSSDFDGATTTSAPVVIVSLASPLPGSDPSPPKPPPPVEPPDPPGWLLKFEPSWGQATVTRYELEIYRSSTRALVVRKDIGKPAVSPGGVCTVSVDSIVTQLPSGQYDVVLRAFDHTGSTPSPTYILDR
jgi:regulation of enolase protein 1 (concanavalin A-like superfamily)